MKNKLMNVYFDNLIHEYNFNVDKFISNKFLTEIKNIFINRREEMMKIHNSANLPFSINSNYTELRWKIDKKLSKLVEKNYIVKNNHQHFDISIYYSNKNIGAYQWHNHWKLGFNHATIVGTFYCHNMQKNKGGEISFSIPGKEEFKIFPKNNTLYLFPYWLAHKPNPYTGEGDRFCFNWGYSTSNRIKHKLIDGIW